MTVIPTTTDDCGGHTVAAPSPQEAEKAREQAALFGLLVTLFRKQPERNTLAALRGTDLRQALEQAGMALGDDFYVRDIDAVAAELDVDFANLFLLPGLLISPHESVQTEGGSGILRGPETADVREYYKYVGFVVDDATPMEPDHVSIELEFLGHLCGEEAAAWEAGDRRKAQDARRYQLDFLNQHLGRWVFGFLNRVENRSRSSFYRELARLTAAFLRDQRETLHDSVGKFEDHDVAV